MDIVTKEFVNTKKKGKNESNHLSLKLVKKPADWKGLTEFRLTPLEKNAFVLGSDKKSDIYIENDDNIDPTQCLISYDVNKNCWFIEEKVASLYGSYVFCKNQQEMEDVKKKYEAFKENMKNLGASEKNEKNYSISYVSEA